MSDGMGFLRFWDFRFWNLVIMFRGSLSGLGEVIWRGFKVFGF